MQLSPKARNRLLSGSVAITAIVAGWCWLGREPAAVVREISTLENITLDSPDRHQVERLRPQIAEALGLSATSPGARRIEILRDFKSSLSEPEHEALLAALMEPRPPGVSEGWFSEYFHSIASLMQSQEGDRQMFARVLATVVRDPSRDGVVRDYAIQHLRQVWDRTDRDGELRSSIEATFRELCSADSGVSPSALLSLHLLGTPAGVDGPELSTASPRSYAVDDAELEPLVLGILQQAPSASAISARMTACRVAGDRGLNAAGSHLLEIARNHSEHALVRMAAVNAIRRIGNSPDLASLAALEPGDQRVAYAIRSALATQTLPE